MNGTNKNNMDDSSPSVTLSIGQLRALVREEVEKAMGSNGKTTKKPENAPKPYLTILEAAKLSRLGGSTIRLAIRKRQLRANQVGSRVIIKRSDLEQFLESHPIEIAPD